MDETLQARLIEILRRFPERRILVVGDAIADQFVHGAIARVSREAPVFIIRHEHTENVPGGAANCAANLAAFGATVSLVGITGQDEAGRALVEKLQGADVNCAGVISSSSAHTTTKVRILAGQTHSTRQQVVRIDYERELPKDKALREQLASMVREQSRDKDAIVISDYNYGVLDGQLIEAISKIAATSSIPVFVDSRFALLSYPGFTSATPNEAEVEQLLGAAVTSFEELAAAAERMRHQLGYRALLITRGGQGMMLLEKGVPALHLKAIGAREPVDVTGAGDTVIATYALASASGASFPDAARLANYAGGLVVMKRGTASVTRDELEHSILHSEG